MENHFNGVKVQNQGYQARSDVIQALKKTTQ